MDARADQRASVRIVRATACIRAPDPAPIAPIVQRALTAALEDVGARWPSEWLFVRRVALDLRVRATAPELDVRSVARAIAGAIAGRIDRIRPAAAAAGAAHGVEGVIAEEVAWFPSEGAARGALLRALLCGRARGWPYAAMRWAATLDDVAGWSTLELGDALAHAVGHATAAVPIPEPAARAWLARWLAPAGATLELAALPAEVRARVLAAAMPGDPDDAARARALAHLFAAWPPAREACVDPRELDRLARRAGAARPAPAASSRAGGLAAWAILLQRSGLGAALWGGLGDERAARAARWAVGRALEAADVGDGDPILRLWAGERPGGAPLARAAFAELDPAPLHAGALRFAGARGWLAGELVLAPLGDGAALMADDLCVDHAPGGVEEALPALVRRFAARLGRPPAGVTVEARLPASTADALAEVDVMALPDPWRAAARAAASIARRLAREAWRIGPRELRGWPARVRDGCPLTIELPRARAARLPIDLTGARLELGASPAMLELG